MRTISSALDEEKQVGRLIPAVYQRGDLSIEIVLKGISKDHGILNAI
jgi:hypothetical protein